MSLNIMKAAFHTLGCKVNSYETQSIREQFEALGFLIVPFDEPADVYVINTCSVTAVGAQKSRQMIHKAKKTNPDAIVVATGCYAQETAGELSARGNVSDPLGMWRPSPKATDGSSSSPAALTDLLSGADFIFGNNEKSKIAEAVFNYIKESHPACSSAEIKIDSFGFSEVNASTDPGFFPKEKSLYSGSRIFAEDLSKCRAFESQRISGYDEKVRAYVKIQDGCDRFCSYCIIPFLRGRSRSRNYDDIINETLGLIKCGYKEIVITGIDLSTFKICKERDLSLIDLLEEIDAMPGIERIRLGSLEVSVVTEDFARRASALKTLCPQFHLSLQSGSASVLKRMNRHYTPDEYFAALTMLKKYFQNPAITTDIIVGFPGETEEEFHETLAFVEKCGFSKCHVFPYSRRKGTRADKMPGQLTRNEKALRVRKLSLAAERLSKEYEKSFSGKPVKVLIEEFTFEAGIKYCLGFSPEYIKYKFPDEGFHINDIVEIIP